MGDPKGFLTIARKTAGYRPIEERINDYSEVELRLSAHDRMQQAARCMDCGVPFCHWACPVANVCPEWQDRLFRGDWVGAYRVLQETNPFPEFTGRVCPALCEASCVLGINDEPVTIRQNELEVIEKAFELELVKVQQPLRRNGKKVAIVGAGPAGLSAAFYLNREGFSVTVYEADKKVGGYLRYGIPDFKLDKNFIDRRVSLMEAEGIKCITNTQIGTGRYAFAVDGTAEVIDPQKLESLYDVILLTIGAREPRDLKNVPGREAAGIMQALDFLSFQNRSLAKETVDNFSTAYGKKVVVIGGGDTGSDCVGTANRQGATRVTQVEVLPKPPVHRSAEEPWPLWPKVLKTSSSHQEGGERLWSTNTKEFIVRNGTVEAVHACRVTWEHGRMVEVPGSDFEISADLVLLAMGFSHVVQDGVVSDLAIATDERGNIRTEGSFRTSNPKVWAAGDSRRGASLVVHAIAEGKAAAEMIAHSFLPY
ncbi:MAG: glutamate synthase subunit beta [Treponema sp.]|nr:glutamate synthase subunit beta [Treponema sp.]